MENQVIDAVSTYPELKAKDLAMLRWVKPGVYEIVLKRFKQSDGTADSPNRLEMNRDGAKALADGLRKSNEQLQAQIDANNKAIGNIEGVITAEMDTADVAAQKQGLA